MAQAEVSELEDSSVDLVTVAQALHWFDITAFSSEVGRVLKKDGILAVWTYNPLEIQAGIDNLISHLYQDALGAFWSPERRLVEENYSGICLPFDEIRGLSFEMSAEWDFPGLIGYLSTWSTVRASMVKTGNNPVELIYGGLLKAWGHPASTRTIRWPLKMRVWRKIHS